jgi:hypothetical protein
MVWRWLLGQAVAEGVVADEAREADGAVEMREEDLGLVEAEVQGLGSRCDRLGAVAHVSARMPFLVRHLISVLGSSIAVSRVMGEGGSGAAWRPVMTG